MNPNEILGFLVPKWDDPLQCGFFAIILLMMGLTIISAHLTARPASWERKWNRGTPDDDSDDLDVDHGSVTDLWNAIATAPEKLAEIMPGMLLVVGLLGTFLGLGLALNHASNILGQPDALSASGAANSMQDLMGLLQGLGTKFKTSTWGIAGFVLLKIWSELTRFEEKRLTWVIGKVKTELERRKKELLATETTKQEALFTQISNAANTISKGFAEQTTLVMEREKASHLHGMHYLQKIIKGVSDDLEKIHAETRATTIAMVKFTESTQGVVENMGEAAQRMAAGADKVGDAANQLVNAVDTFKSQFTDVLDNVRKDLGAAINDMSTQASVTLERGSAQLGDATREISTALGILSADVKETMGQVKGSIKESLDIQEKAARRFTESNNALLENMNMTTNTVDKLGVTIGSGLDSVSESGRRMLTIGKNLEKSIQSMEALTARIIELPSALEPLKAIPNNLQALLLALKPLSDQKIVLGKLVGFLEDLESRREPTEAANSGWSGNAEAP